MRKKVNQVWNNDPFAPWNGPDRHDPAAPWNDPCHKDDPFAPWNDPMADRRDYERYLEREGLDYERRQYLWD